MRQYGVSVEDAIARLVVDPDYDCGNGPEPCVHTFRSSPVGLLGAHWSLESVREAMGRYGVEQAGEQASAMGHGLVFIDENGPVFLEARDA
jgi:hypothetical protein